MVTVPKNNFFAQNNRNWFYYGIYLKLVSAQKIYPCFTKWYFQKVIPDTIISGQRKILIENRNNTIAGISILKISNEIKLSTLRVDDNFVNSGIGIKLFEKSFQYLGTTKPFLTVSEQKLPLFKKIFDYYGFKITSIYDNLYIQGQKEYFYNEFNRYKK